ncbi:hypothetical protein [Gallalistipes aquisgranensis]|uniref:hypothetical protein n=1 Tax=Gallalistipes aquisgranensis TaxID=2779358 RepID=UPI001CF81457|nr:hypothetical protein [Gallalistipes aquisgranensis]MBE5034180.1 hypothetical protein [Gallalistipes aquisgranensis]
MEPIRIDSGPWNILVEEILAVYAPGSLIPHEWLKNRFRIRDKSELKFKDYGNEAEFIAALERIDRTYQFLVESLQSRLLEDRKGYLVNRHGEGYMILPYDEQVAYAYNRFIGKLERSIKKTDRIMKYRPPVSAEQQARDNDIIARYSWFTQMVPVLKK